MAKRFHDTEIWDEDWFIALPKDYRDFALFIKDKCDHAGIYRPNIAKFNKLYDCNIETQKAIDLINNGPNPKERIIVLPNGRWLLPDFISFQYGNHLNSNNRVHASIIKVLAQNEVNLRSIRGLIEDTYTLKDKDKDKDINKGIVKGRSGEGEEIYSYYSKTIKPGAKEDSIRSITKLLKTHTKEDLIGRIDAYHKQLDRENKQDIQYYIQANNFFGRQARYKDFEPIKKIEYKKADPNCKVCKGKGIVLIQDTMESKICDCRIKKE